MSFSIPTKYGNLDQKIAKVHGAMKVFESWFPDCKLTLLIRHQEGYDSSLLMSKDHPAEIISAVRYMGQAMGVKE